MQDLLPYYERELVFLRRYSREFSERYPKIAGGLLMAGEVCEDPHIERMIQSFALLSARVSKRIDDDYPEFTEALLEVLYPHYLRPFPSCSIVHLDQGSSATQITAPIKVPRGTVWETRAVKGVKCKFQTAYDVTIAPVRVAQAQFNAIISPPESVVLPSNAVSKISIDLEITSEQMGFTRLELSKMRVFLDGEASFCAVLRDALFTHSVCAFVEVPRTARWVALKSLPIAEVGFDDQDALIDFPARSHPSYRILTEYFSFPEKFNFFDIDIALISALLPSNCKEFSLHLVLTGFRPDSNIARMLGTLSAKNFLLNCTPVINLFKSHGSPIRLTHRGAQYPVVADSANAFAYEVYSIESVNMVRQTPQGESITEFRPFYSLHHGQTPGKSGHYWAMRRNELVALKSPGYETEISIVDIDFDPAAVEIDTLSLELRCTNRDLPTLLGYGSHGGDLFPLDGGSLLGAVSFLRKPSQPQYFERGRGAHWRLISHLALNHLSLTQGGLDAFREILTLYDLSRSPTSQRQIGAIVSVEHRASTVWLPGNPFASLVRGIEVRMVLDEEGFVGSGLHVFASVIERFLGLYVHINSFTQLVIFSRRTGEELLRCRARSGDLNLA
nr:type VI secretion system baseplate subunit TssF [uncultured Albidiferax sp.]